MLCRGSSDRNEKLCSAEAVVTGMKSCTLQRQ